MAFPPDDLDSITETPQGSSTSRLVLWLVIASLLGLLLPLNLLTSTLREESTTMETELTDIQATLEAPESISPEEQALRDDLLQSREVMNALSNLRSTLELQHIDWPGVMLTVGDYDETRLQLSAVNQTGRRLILSGQAADEGVVMAYAQMLRDSEWFTTVLIQSISQMTLPTQPPAADGSASPAVRIAEFDLAIELKVNEP